MKVKKRMPKSNIHMIIGKKLRELRNQSGLSQTQMASKLGISYQQVQKYEKGANCPNITRLFQIADVFEVNPIKLILPEGYKEEKKKATQLEKDEVNVLQLYRKLSRKSQKKAVFEMLQAILYAQGDRKKYSG